MLSSKLRITLGSLCLALAAGSAVKAGDPVRSADDRPPPRGDRALIVVGLAGDSQHETLFRKTALAWRDWLTGPLKFPVADVRILFGAKGDPDLGARPATAAAIAEEAGTIRRSMTPAEAPTKGSEPKAKDDGPKTKDQGLSRLWVFFLGHANEREGHAFFHLSGPDLGDDDLGALFKGITCREQVFWMTTPGSGWFLAGLSAKGRIVITATTNEQEFNETEFPSALADAGRLALAELDADKDGKVSVWELFVRTGENVAARFEADMRTPTEHAWLDDDGDKQGSERPEPPPGDAAKDKAADPKLKDTAKEKAADPKLKDGELAKKTFLPY